MRYLIAGWCLLTFLTGCNIARFSHDRVERQEIETSPLTAVELSTFNGDVEVIPSNESKVEIEVAFRAYGATASEAEENCEAMSCVVEAEDGELLIRATKPSDQWMGSASFKVKIPDECSLKLQTSNGKVMAEDFPRGVDAHTSNGGITLSRIGTRVFAKTSNGSIRLKDCEGEFDLQSSNGRVYYSGRPRGIENRIQTSNGRIELHLPADQCMEVSTRTSNGKIQCTLPVQRILNESKREFAAVLGTEQAEQADCKIQVRTSNGSIRIDPTEATTVNEAPAEVDSELSI